MPLRKSKRANVNSITHYGIMGGLAPQRALSLQSVAGAKGRATNKLVIPSAPGAGLQYMLGNNPYGRYMLSRNPQCSGGVGRMATTTSSNAYTSPSQGKPMYDNLGSFGESIGSLYDAPVLDWHVLKEYVLGGWFESGYLADYKITNTTIETGGDDAPFVPTAAFKYNPTPEARVISLASYVDTANASANLRLTALIAQAKTGDITGALENMIRSANLNIAGPVNNLNGEWLVPKRTIHTNSYRYILSIGGTSVQAGFWVKFGNFLMAMITYKAGPGDTDYISENATSILQLFALHGINGIDFDLELLPTQTPDDRFEPGNVDTYTNPTYTPCVLQQIAAFVLQLKLNNAFGGEGLLRISSIVNDSGTVDAVSTGGDLIFMYSIVPSDALIIPTAEKNTSVFYDYTTVMGSKLTKNKGIIDLTGFPFCKQYVNWMLYDSSNTSDSGWVKYAQSWLELSTKSSLSDGLGSGNCKATGAWTGQASMDAWCNSNCPGNCPSTMCVCGSGPGPAPPAPPAPPSGTFSGCGAGATAAERWADACKKQKPCTQGCNANETCLAGVSKGCSGGGGGGGGGGINAIWGVANVSKKTRQETGVIGLPVKAASEGNSLPELGLATTIKNFIDTLAPGEDKKVRLFNWFNVLTFNPVLSKLPPSPVKGDSVTTCGTDCTNGAPSRTNWECLIQPGSFKVQPAVNCSGTPGPPVAGKYFCGSSFQDAKTNCKTVGKCAVDADCKSGQKCFSGITCGSAPSPPPPVTGKYLCGTSYQDAVTNCKTAGKCTVNADCTAGQNCYSGIPCNTPSGGSCGTYADICNGCTGGSTCVQCTSDPSKWQCSS